MWKRIKINRLDKRYFSVIWYPNSTNYFTFMTRKVMSSS
jgi:hypothetical protein